MHIFGLKTQKLVRRGKNESQKRGWGELTKMYNIFPCIFCINTLYGKVNIVRCKVFPRYPVRRPEQTRTQWTHHSDQTVYFPWYLGR